MDNRDRFGFGFWLKWILSFSGSLIASTVVWTLLMKAWFGKISGYELTITWARLTVKPNELSLPKRVDCE